MRLFMPLLGLAFWLSTLQANSAPPPQAPQPPLETLAKRTYSLQQWISGQLGSEARKTLQTQCAEKRNSSREWICDYIPFLKEWARDYAKDHGMGAGHRKLRLALHHVTEPVLIHGEIRNWDTLRMAPVGRLSRALRAFRLSELYTLEAKALQEKRCPNNVAAAVAAQLEDFPGHATRTEMSHLFEQAAHCTQGKGPKLHDRSILLTRAGLLHYVNQEIPEALADWQRVVEQDPTYSERALYWMWRSCQNFAEWHHCDMLGDRMRKLLSEQFPMSFHRLVMAITLHTKLGLRLNTSSHFNTLTSASPRSQQTSTEANLQLAHPIALWIGGVEALEQDEERDMAAWLAAWILRRGIPSLHVHLSDDEVLLILSHTSDHYKVTHVGDFFLGHPNALNLQSATLLYPVGFLNVLKPHAKEADPYLLLSLAYKESAFNPDATSSANAQGLMQLNPQTALELADGSALDLKDPSVNASLGVPYLESLVKRYDNKLYLALAAYNAGTDNVDGWLRNYPTTDPILFIDLIPFRETRGYVADVLRHYYWYRLIYEPQRLASSLAHETLQALISPSLSAHGDFFSLSPSEPRAP